MSHLKIFFFLALISIPALGHHSTVAYDFDNIDTVGGIVTSVFWRNPHVRITLERMNERGETETWEIESGSRNALERVGVGEETVKIGDRVSLTGAPSKNGLTTMAAVLLMLADGTEIALWPQRASALGRTVDSVPLSRAAAESSSRDARGIFRVWSRMHNSSSRTLPFTPEALAARDAWDPATDDPALRCIPPGMPSMMSNPYPIEFVDQGEEILLRLEEWDGVRTIHMPHDVTADDEAATPTGHSVGRWSGSTLIVTTTRISDSYFDDLGTPQSEAVTIVERFTLSDDERQLDYEMTIQDPLTFTAPAVLKGAWTWIPGEEIKPFNCSLPQNTQLNDPQG